MDRHIFNLQNDLTNNHNGLNKPYRIKFKFGKREKMRFDQCNRY